MSVERPLKLSFFFEFSFESRYKLPQGVCGACGLDLVNNAVTKSSLHLNHTNNLRGTTLLIYHYSESQGN